MPTLLSRMQALALTCVRGCRGGAMQPCFELIPGRIRITVSVVVAALLSVYVTVVPVGFALRVCLLPCGLDADAIEPPAGAAIRRLGLMRMPVMVPPTPFGTPAAPPPFGTPSLTVIDTDLLVAVPFALVA